MASEPAMLVGLYSDQWKRFTEEWLQAFKNDFAMIRRLSCPGDRGLDALAFTDTAAFDGPWRSFQCKRYGGPSLSEWLLSGATTQTVRPQMGAKWT